MITSLKLVLVIAAFICEVLAAVGVGGKINLVAAGLALWLASIIF